MTFRIRGLIFEIKPEKHLLNETGDFEMYVTFANGDWTNITKELGCGAASTESGCCYQAMLWMERVGI